jgi:hypothetical protein
MSKDKLRNELFDSYFEITEGVLAIDLVDKLSYVRETWAGLHKICVDNVDGYYFWSSLRGIKLVERDGDKYLVIRERPFNYIIIDLTTMNNINKLKFKRVFDEDFFVTNFDEAVMEDYNAFPDMYRLDSYTGNTYEILDFYIQNEDVLNLTPRLYYKIKKGDAWTYFSIDFATRSAQMGFQTPNQYLYEQLFLNSDLSASSMQDAQNRIGLDKMCEMFDRIKEIKLPIEIIPNDLYEEYVLNCKENKKLSKISQKD